MVVWDRELYLLEASRQLEDHIFNKPVQQHVTSAVSQLISAKDLPSTAKLLVQPYPDNPSSIFFQKSTRPILLAAQLCQRSRPTERISEYLDYILQPLVQNLSSYVKDSTHALNILSDLNSKPSFNPHLLFTLDVVSLYTSIPHSDGLKALNFFLDSRLLQ